MGRALLWVECLSACLFLVVMIIACLARLQKRGRAVFLAAAVVAVGLMVLAGLTVSAGYVWFSAHIGRGLFLALCLFTLAFAASAIAILCLGFRRPLPEERPSAASWPRGKMTVCFLAAGMLAGMTFWNLDLGVRQQLGTVRAEAGAISLSAGPLQVADKDNAALIYERAFKTMAPGGTAGSGAADERKPDEAALRPEGWRKDWTPWIDPASAAFDPQDPELRGFLKRQAPAIALLCQAARKPACWFSHGYQWLELDMMLPEIPWGRHAAYLLLLDARVKAADGDIRAALESSHAALGLSRHLAGEPMLVAVVTGMVIEGLAAPIAARLLAGNQVPGDALDLLSLDEEFSFWRQLERALRMEEAFGISVFAAVGMGNIDPFGSGGFFEDSPWASSQVVGALYRVFLLNEDFACFRSVATGYRGLLAKPYHQAKEGWESLMQSDRSDVRGLVSAMIVPSYSRLVERAPRVDASYRLLEASLAMHRYRARQGKFPPKLEDLVPALLQAVPEDPFSGKPMILGRRGGALVVYSVGPDGKDDGGAPMDSENKAGDVVLEVARSGEGG